MVTKGVDGGVDPRIINQGLQKQTTQEAKKSDKLSGADAARIAEQAGFQKEKKKRGLNLGDSSQAPIPLPEDEVNLELWDQRRLEALHESLGNIGSELGEAKAGESDEIGGAILEGVFLPTEASNQKLEKITARVKERQDFSMDDEAVSASLGAMGIEVKDAGAGENLLRAGLLVSGQADKASLSGNELLNAARQVVEDANGAVGQAQKMNKGIDLQLNMNRTFMFNR
ncbi:MAG: hypothetical protein VYA34_05235 [Myxococcota bacterium]|nr:hypothetical protein [Myxococcota bacterium]